jgi:hypothetical protein
VSIIDAKTVAPVTLVAETDVALIVVEFTTPVARVFVLG